MLRLLIMFALLNEALATSGIDVATAVSTEGFKCLKSKGYNFAIVRAYRSVNSFDPNAIQNIKNARSAGMIQVDAYIFPCMKCGNAATQIATTLNTLTAGGAKIGMLWLDIEGVSTYWDSNIAMNINFIQAMVNKCIQLGVKYGIYTSKSEWNSITQGTRQFASAPLWYAHYDDKASFADFVSFGGWSKPFMKQYADDKMECDVEVDKNFY